MALVRIYMIGQYLRMAEQPRCVDPTPFRVAPKLFRVALEPFHVAPALFRVDAE